MNGERWIPDSANWSSEQIDRLLDIWESNATLARERFTYEKERDNERDDRVSPWEARLEQTEQKLISKEKDQALEELKQIRMANPEFAKEVVTRLDIDSLVGVLAKSETEE